MTDAIKHDQDTPAVIVKGVSKYFSPSKGQRSIKAAFTSMFQSRAKKVEYSKAGYWALKDVSFEVKTGEFFGIVGRNGSGKSTLLKMIAGVYTPTSGSIQVNGKLVPFIELGVGFNSELSGRDNVFLNGALLGFTRSEMNAMYEEIVDFAELQEHMDVKLKNFSSGMQVRLAFSIAIRAKSDILLLDEVLAVGDAEFQRKCYQYFKDLKEQGKTVILVTHDMTAVRQYCTRAALLMGGKNLIIGTPDEISKDYIRLFNNETTSSSKAKDNSKRWGSNIGMIKSIDVKVSEKELIIKSKTTFANNCDGPIFGVSIKDQSGLKLIETNTLWKKIPSKKYLKNKTYDVSWRFPNVFTNGRYYVTLAVSEGDGVTFLEWWEDCSSFEVVKDEVTSAILLCEGTYHEQETA